MAHTLEAANNMINEINVVEFITEYGSVLGSYEFMVFESYPAQYVYSMLDKSNNKIKVDLSFYDFIEVAYRMKLHQYDRCNIGGFNVPMTKEGRDNILKAYYQNECDKVNFRAY